MDSEASTVVYLNRKDSQLKRAKETQITRGLKHLNRTKSQRDHQNEAKRMKYLNRTMSQRDRENDIRERWLSSRALWGTESLGSTSLGSGSALECSTATQEH
jgi:hypothetical protein